MKVLFYSCIFSFLTFALCAVGDTSDGFLARWAASLVAPHTQPTPPEHKDGEILEHAEVSLTIPSAEAEILERPAVDPQEALKNKDSGILEAASVPGALDEFKAQENKEDLRYGTHEEIADLDLTLNPNQQGTSAVRNAEPTA